MSNNMTSIISPGEEWDEYLDIFNGYGLNDIYFHYNYLNLYVDKDSPALIESFDFETAYGYSGPISTFDGDEFLDLA